MVGNGGESSGGVENGMNIHVITYAYALGEELLQTFAAADAPNITWHLFLHSTRPYVVETCELLSRCSNVHYYPYGTDRGLARDCNEGLIAAQQDGADVVVQLCDDILSGPGDVQKLAEALLDNPHCAYVDGMAFVERGGIHRPSGFDAAALNLKVVEKIGYFDVNFWPVNFEDIDWKRRAELAGHQHITLQNTSFVHRDCNPSAGSGEFMDKFYRTRDYYVAKWGGDQKQERYERPFNDARYDLTIPRECIDNPYPEYKREDILA